MWLCAPLTSIVEGTACNQLCSWHGGCLDVQAFPLDQPQTCSGETLVQLWGAASCTWRRTYGPRPVLVGGMAAQSSSVLEPWLAHLASAQLGAAHQLIKVTVAVRFSSYWTRAPWVTSLTLQLDCHCAGTCPL